MSDERKPIPLTEWQEEALRSLFKAVEPIHDWLVSAGVIAPPSPTDPRERALHLRKHRNTGPGKPIQEQRRKR